MICDDNSFSAFYHLEILAERVLQIPNTNSYHPINIAIIAIFRQLSHTFARGGAADPHAQYRYYYLVSYKEYEQLMQQGRYEEAARYAEGEARSGGESDEFWLTQHAKALVRGGKFKAALEVAERALDLKPDSPFAVAVAADALVGVDLPEKALEHYEEILQDRRLFQKGRKGVLKCLGELKRWDDLLGRIEAWSLPEADALPWRVKALGSTGHDEEALEACRRWLELKAHYPAALWERTELEIRTEGLEAVLKKMERLARIRSLPEIYREIYASLCRRAGKPDDAIKTYEGLGAEGETAKIQKKMVFTMAKSGREREAIPLLEELLKAEPADIYVHSSYAAACRRVGDIERAVNFYQKLLGLHPEERSLYGRIKRLQKQLEAGG